MEQKLMEIILAGWLHDIGKFAQRAGQEQYCSSDMESHLCKVHQGGWYSHKHVLYTEGVLQHFRDVLPDEVCAAEVVRLAANHHNPSSYDEWIIAEGDRISSGSDRRSEMELEAERDAKFYEKPLISLISTLQIDNRTSATEKFVPVAPLEGEAILGSDSVRTSQQEYCALWKQFEHDFLQLKGLSYESFMKALDTVLLRYWWCIPSSTIDDPDISLYQHSKTTASFAGILYRYHRDTAAENEAALHDKKTEKILFVNGDISGIQKYIFDLKSSADNAKILRARSFQLLALSQFFAENLVSQFDGTGADIVTWSGGKFLVVLPCTSAVKQRLSEIRLEYESFFLSEFAGKLALIISNGTGACAGDLSDKDSEGVPSVIKLINRIGYDSDCAKQQKMQCAIFQKGAVLSELYDQLQQYGECACCHTLPAQQTGGLCVSCETLRDIGRDLMKSSGILLDSSHICRFGQMVHLLREVTGGACAVNAYIPGYASWYLPYVAPYNDAENLQLCTFEEIAKRALGNQKLAMFKADIDNLGLVFNASLGNRMSFSRYADMSRIFQYFFSAYYAYYLRRHKEFEQKLYTVFAGGDDLCVIGAWDAVMQFACDFHKQLDKLSNNNPSVTLSGGIVLASPTLPLRFMASAAEEQLEKSKKRRSNGLTVKNAITVFDTTVSWDIYERCLSDGKKLFGCLCSKDAKRNLPVAAVYKLLDFADRASRLCTDGNIRDLMWKSAFHYMAERVLAGKDDEIRNWYVEFGSDEKIKYVRIAASYALYANRDKTSAKEDDNAKSE